MPLRRIGEKRATGVAEVGARIRLPVERKHVRQRGGGEARRGAPVDAREQVPVGLADVRQRGVGRTPQCVKWAIENGAESTRDTCTYAAWGGHLEMLHFLRESGCP